MKVGTIISQMGTQKNYVQKSFFAHFNNAFSEKKFVN